MASDNAVRAMLAAQQHTPTTEYLSWDRVRNKTPPEGLTHEEWWFGLKMARRSAQRDLASLLAIDGTPFHFNLPDQLLRLIDEINRSASGNISIGEEVTNPGTRDRYVVTSLIEEAITSSQLEGAATSRRVAKEMLRSGRPPRDHSERMIVNNFHAMRLVLDFQDDRLTPERVLELHRVVTDGTLADPEDAGRLQTDQAERIAVYGDHDQLLHSPPHVDELPERLQRLCDFANADPEDESLYLPPVLRAVALHFMVGYDHYFVDGNGRTARALFYWSMVRQGYWLTEFLTISTILKGAPAKYGRSFLLSEDDEGDLTHFFVYHCQVIVRAIEALHEYLARKADEVRDLRNRLGSTGRFNHRQLAMLEHAIKNPGATYTAQSHARSHQVTTQTARQDLGQLEELGLLRHETSGRRMIWSASPDLRERLI
ncbi:Fic family protein [Nocardioides sp. HDW12B]|uniref:Fic family protein n=1 Tax=Nocardioides sp. HDW12B TaxID=2714939 RepID=UPI00198006EC|nr:Fic family protein [Nocardioides sp. HDW12B]